MDNHELRPRNSPATTTIDLNHDDQHINHDGDPNDDQWSQNMDDIELDEDDDDESDLFLRDSYIKPKNKHLLPYAKHPNNTNSNQHGYTSLPIVASQSENVTYCDSKPSVRAASQKDGHQHQSSNSGRPNGLTTTTSNPNGYGQQPIDAFVIHDVSGSKPGSPTDSASIIYQVPNFQRFAGSLAPTSPNSVIISFVIIVVILCVTIVPIMLPQQQDSSNDYDDDEASLQPGDDIFKLAQDDSQSSRSRLYLHSDVRCKCVCPPPWKFKSARNIKQSANISIAEAAKQRRLYVGNTNPNQCNCNNIVQPQLNDSSIVLKDFCVHCECRYQSRNTSTIRRNVIFFIFILSGLGVFMIIQWVLKYMKISKRDLPRQFKWLNHQLAGESYR